MRFGSVCSGIESASVAWEPLGFEPAWFSEIEEFPSAVLAHHWPQVANLGDMTVLPQLIRAGLVDAPDVLVGGTPCQAYSLAGARKSLDDERGQLTLTYVDIANAIDEQRQPGDECVTVWENVPGVLSTHDNAFGCFLGDLAGSGHALQPGEPPALGKSSNLWRWNKKQSAHVARWPNAGYVSGPRRSIAWRVIDAQYFGVAQRRRRVFVVSSARNGFDPRKVLFESEGLRRDTAPSREAGQGFTHDVANCIGISGVGTHRIGDTRGADPVVAVIQNATAGKDQNGLGIVDGLQPAYTLDTRSHNAVVEVVHGTQDPVTSNNLAFCLGRNNGGENVLGHRLVSFGEYVDDETASTMFSRNYKDAWDLVVSSNPPLWSPCACCDDHFCNLHGTHAFECSCPSVDDLDFDPYEPFDYRVRRLTEVECARLQGFPDHHTLIPWAGKPANQCPSGHQYKAYGNSKAVPCVQFIGLRIMLHTEGYL